MSEESRCMNNGACGVKGITTSNTVNNVIKKVCVVLPKSKIYSKS